MEFYLDKNNKKTYIDCNSNTTVDNYYFNNLFKKSNDYNEIIYQKYLTFQSKKSIKTINKI